MRDGRRRADFWRGGRRSWFCCRRRSLWRGRERFWLEWLGLCRHGWGWWLLWQRGRGRNWRSDRHRSGRHNWRGCLRLGCRLHLYARRDHHGRVRRDMRDGLGNGNRLMSFGVDGFLGGGCCVRRNCGKLGLELANEALQFCKSLRIFFGKVVELFAESGLPNKQGNEQNWRGEQRQAIDHVQ